MSIPLYGYSEPVRVCRYCYDLLDDQVLCDFDANNLDEEQWRSVHFQSKANVDNLGRKAISLFGFRSRSSTITSGYDTRDGRDNCCESSDSETVSLLSHYTTTLSSGASEQDHYSDESGSTISNNSLNSVDLQETSSTWRNKLRLSINLAKSKEKMQRMFVDSIIK